jgi:Tol biopolymer transport system component
MKWNHDIRLWAFLLTWGLLPAGGCGSPADGTSGDPWSRADQIVRSIQRPVIPDRSYRLSDYGAAGDGITDNRPAFERAIAACSEAGGGRLVVEPGNYLINGPLHLKSHLDLHLEEGARIFFGSDPRAYLPVVLTSWEGTRCYNYSPFIYAFEVTDVAITGKGEIDGQGSDPWNGWKELQGPDQRLIRKMNNEEVPLEERVFGEGHYLRPHLVQFYKCERILVEGITITDSPFWCLHLLYSSHITVRGVTYDARNLNNDGIDPDCSENILIEEVTFNNLDDNIAIKAGRDREARSLGIPSRNIVVRDCHFRGHNAIAVGSEMSGGVHDVYVEDCDYAGEVMYGFYLKGNRDRGGEVRDIYARNLSFDTTRSTIIIDSNYKNEGSCCPPKFRNIHIEKVRSNVATDQGIYLKGFSEQPLDSIFIRDVEIHSARIPVEVTETDHLVMDRVVINGQLQSRDQKEPQWIRTISPETGREVWQITSGGYPSVACYFEGQAFSGDERYVVYSSMRTGKWMLHRTDLETGMEEPLTFAERDIQGDEYTVMPDGKRVCYIDGWVLYATHVESAEEEVLFDYTGKLPDRPRFSGSFTSDGRYTLVWVNNDTLKAIYRTDLETGEVLEVMRRREGKLSHPLINPRDPMVITYVPGPDTQNDMTLPMEQRARTWKVDLRAGTDRQFLTVPYGFRATHESWTWDGTRFTFFRKTRPGWSPVAVCSIDKEGKDFRVHYQSDTIRLGHGTSSRDGRWFISDSQEPGTNELVLVDLSSGRGEVLCYPNSSVEGDNEAFAHVHPSFSPKGNYVCFTSDRTGTPQVYVVPVGDLTNSSSPSEDEGTNM